MFTVIPYSASLDLSEFYQNAREQGFYRHTDPSVFDYDRELRAQVWIIYKDNRPIGSFAAHTAFPRPEFKGQIAYMIWNSMCILDHTPIGVFGPKTFHYGHQNIMSQIVSPVCIRWVYEQEGTEDINMYSAFIENRPPPYNKVANKFHQRYQKSGYVTAYKTSVIGADTVQWWTVNHKLFMKDSDRAEKWPVTYQNSL